MRWLLLLAISAMPAIAAELPKPVTVASGMKNPESVCVANGRVFVTVIGEFDQNGDGSVVEVLKDGTTKVLVGNLNDPKGIVAFQNNLFVTDKTQVLRIDLASGKSEVWAAETDFPKKPKFLNDIVADEQGTLYISDSGDLQGAEGAIFKLVRPLGKKAAPSKPKVTLVADAGKYSWIKTPNGLLMDSLFHLLVLDFTSGELHRLRLPDGLSEKVADGFPGGDGLGFDQFGRLYITSWKEGKLWAIPRPGEKPVLMADAMQQAADLGFDLSHNRVLVPDMKAGTLLAFPAQPPGWEIDQTPLNIGVEVAFPNLKWTGWDSGEESGKVVPFRPLVLTSPSDNSQRTFLATQHGVIHVFEKNNNPQATKVFLDLQSKVFYDDNQNEQGLLGLAFSPKYATDGEFYLFYTVKNKKFTNVLSRFRVSKTDPNKADPTTEEVLLTVPHKYWNHDGGTLAFGPDGYLYLVLGDGGAANDPDDYGQDLRSLLGKILRLDVSKKGTDAPYAIPADNPFLGRKDVRPEIFAYGVRNPWRLSFDRQTGLGWFADVGQNLWEEINILEKGGNYGWRRREALHPFWVEGVGPNTKMIDPVLEYHHDVGKSITGGHVYRGTKFPELQGHYLYADYVSGKIWAMKYDAEKKRVVANRPIQDRGSPIMSFGEDHDGEVYLMTYAANGKGVFQFTRLAK